MKKLFKRLLLSASIPLLSVFPYKSTWSCGPELSPADMRFALFQPDLSGRNNLAALYYRMPSTGHFLSDPQKTDYFHNCSEWQQLTGKTVSLKDIYTIQYDIAADDFLYAYRHNDWEPLKDNSFIQWLRKPANKTSLDYMAYAKQVEYSQFGDVDPWGIDTGFINRQALIDTAIHNCSNTTSAFLQQRYAFQIVKLCFYERADDKRAGKRLIDYYEIYLKDKPTIVSDWGLYFYACAQSDHNLYIKYSMECFDKCEEKKGPIFGNISRKDLDSFSIATADKHTAALVYVFKALKQPGRSLPTIQQVYNIEPDCSYLPLLICREVSKLEDWISTPQILGFNSPVREALFSAPYKDDDRDYHLPDTTYAYYAEKNIRSDKMYLRSFGNFLHTMLSRKNVNKDMIHLAIAHLDNMDGRYADATSQLNQLKALKDTTYQRQVIAEKLIAAIYSRDITNAAVKQYLYSQFQELERLGFELRDNAAGQYPDWASGNKDMRAALLLMLSQRYQQAGDIITAGLLFQQAGIPINEYIGYYDDESPAVIYPRIAYFDKYASPEEVEQLISFKHRSGKTAFEKMITPSTWAPDDFYRDLKGTLLVRQQRFREAAMEMEKIADDFWDKNWEYKGYLTRLYIGSPGILVPREDRTKRYPITSKKAILRDIVALQDSLSQAGTLSAKARFHYLLGNAYFNISYYGRDWMMSAYGQSDNEPRVAAEGNYAWAYFSFYPNANIYKSDYYQCSHAFDMYEKALRLCGKDKELHAKVLLMMSVCDEYRYAFFSERSKYKKGIDDYWRETPAYGFPYLKMLKEKDGDTQVFEDSYTECPDVATFGRR